MKFNDVFSFSDKFFLSDTARVCDGEYLVELPIPSLLNSKYRIKMEADYPQLTHPTPFLYLWVIYVLGMVKNVFDFIRFYYQGVHYFIEIESGQIPQLRKRIKYWVNYFKHIGLIESSSDGGYKIKENLLSSKIELATTIFQEPLYGDSIVHAYADDVTILKV